MVDPSMVDGTFLILQEPATWWDSFLQILQAGSIIGAAGTAIWGINAWRRETVGRRKIELAEETLANFYEARRIMRSVRSTAGFGGEGQSRPREDDEDPDDARYFDGVYVPIERLQKHSEFFARIAASKYRFMALFGPTTATPFDELEAITNEIVGAADSLFRRRKSFQRRQNIQKQDHDRMRELESIIWWAGTDNDPLNDRLEGAITSVEQTCQPILTGRVSLISQHLPNWIRRDPEGTAP